MVTLWWLQSHCTVGSLYPESNSEYRLWNRWSRYGDYSRIALWGVSC